MKPRTCLAALLALAVAPLCLRAEAGAGRPPPDWARDAVWYQIFPERFRNGDPANDPVAASLEDPANAPAGWRVSSWTREWYARDAWEQELGKDFFANGVFLRRYGGDLRGVIDKLDYLRDLGINTLYFNPVFHARSLHKYDGSSFHHIDAYFGPDPAGDLALMETETSDPKTWKWTAADKLFLELLREARKRGLRVVIDGVFNHTGTDFFAFRDLARRGASSPYKEWYVVLGQDDPETRRNEFDYEGWWGFKSLPVFANSADGRTLHPGPKAYIFDCTRRWMDPDGDGDPSDGIDGWRLDVAEEVPAGFWVEWNALVHSLNPKAYTSAEIWGPSGKYLAEAGFDAAMNYDGFAMPVKRFLVDAGIDAATFASQLDTARTAHGEGRAEVLQNLMDSHDTDRLASMVVNGYQRSRFGLPRLNFDQANAPRSNADYLLRKPDATERRLQRLVGLFQAAYVGAPMLYYGTEAGLWGADDPCDRMPMSWPDLAMEPQTRGPAGPDGRNDDTNFDPAIHAFYKQALAARSAHAVLRRGDYTTLSAHKDGFAFAFARRLGATLAVCAVNRGAQTATLELDLTRATEQVPAGLATVLAVEGEEAPPEARQSGERLRLTLPAHSGVVLVGRPE